MNALDGHLLRAYLDGELDADATDAFEVLMMERPDLAEAVDADSAFRIGLNGLSAVGERVSATTSPRVAPRSALRLVWAAAASIVVAVGAAALFQQERAAATMDATTLAYVDKMRGISARTEVPIPQTSTLVLLVPVAGASSESCAAEIALQQPPASALRARAAPDEFGYASLVVPTRSLAPGEAVVSVACGQEPAANYEITFVAK